MAVGALLASLVSGVTDAPAVAATVPTAWRAAVKATDAAAYAPPECADLLFLGARGSAEDDANKDAPSPTFGATVQRVRDALHGGLDAAGSTITVRQVYVDYNALPVGALAGDVATGKYSAASGSAYFQNAQKGFKLAERVLQGSIDNCPDEKWVVSGYSQGALIADSLANAFDLPDKWAGLYTVADTANFPGRRTQVQGSAFANGHRPTGLYAAAFRVKVNIPADLRSAAFAYCIRFDAMCDYVSMRNFLANWASGFKLHGLYKDDYSLNVAVAGLVNRVAAVVRPKPVRTNVLADPGLRACARAQLKQDLGLETSSPTEAQVAMLTKLDCIGAPQGSPPVASLKGLEYAARLGALSVVGPVADLKPIARLPLLTRLYLDKTLISSLEPLSRNQTLRVVNVTDSPITDPSPLATMSPSITGSLNGDRVTDVRSISSLVSSRAISVTNQTIPLPDTFVGVAVTLPDVWAPYGRNGASSQLEPGVGYLGFPDTLQRQTAKTATGHWSVTWLQPGDGHLYWFSNDLCTQCFQWNFSGHFDQRVK